MTITIGTDSYTTVAEADSYFADTFKNAEWTALDAPTKEICLKMACRKMETLHFTGNKTISTQLLEFPRHYSSKSFTVTISNVYDGTPQDVKNAQSELALWLYQNKNNQVLNLQRMSIKSMSMGNESYTFSDNYNPQGIICVEASEYLDKWIRKGFKVC